MLCERARNYRYLLTGSPSDALPVDGDEAEKLARMLGYTHRPQQSLRDDYRRVTRRARAIVERIFYDRATTEQPGARATARAAANVRNPARALRTRREVSHNLKSFWYQRIVLANTDC